VASLDIIVEPPEKGGGTWATHPYLGKVPADDVHRWYDWAPVGVLERRQTPLQMSDMAR
jgi:hypothetical protein